MTPERGKLRAAVGRLCNTTLLSTLIRIGFRLMAWVTGVRDVDYFYDRREGVWLVKSDDTYLAVGFRATRFSPKLVRRYVEQQRTDSQDYWHLDLYQLQRGGVVLDIGAGAGFDTVLFCLSVGPEGRVFAVEPHPRTARLLRATCQHNRLSNVTIVECAITDTIGEVGITDLQNHLENRVVPCNGGAGVYLVGTMTVDALCDKYGILTVDLLKMNIEGAETCAIKGMTRAIGRVQRACIACHDFVKPAPDGKIKLAITEFMTKHGFDVTTRDGDARPWVRDHVYCARHPAQAGASVEDAASFDRKLRK